jgi:hypothetical protein
MARHANQPAEHVQQSAPRPPAADAPAGEDRPPVHVPLNWRIVFIVFAVSMALLVLYEVTVDSGKILGALFGK